MLSFGWRIGQWMGVLGLCVLCSVSARAAGETTLNFKGAELTSVIASVAGITGKNFIIDPRVKGKVTLLSSRPLSSNEVYQVFLSVLDVHGFAAVPSGDVIKIIPNADAKQNAVPNSTDERPGRGDEIVTRVLEVMNVNAAQLVPILRPLVPPQGHLAAYPQTNVLIISDTAVNIQRLMEIIRRVDQPTSGELEIVALQHAAAADLVRVLNTLQQQVKNEAKATKPTVVADERTNSILISGERQDRIQLRAIISHLDTPSELTGDTHVIYLRYAKAKDLVPVLTGVGESSQKDAKGKAPPEMVGEVRIQADESSNALVITAPPAVFRSFESVIRQLDVRRAQVLVEAIIAEVSDNASAELGVQWVFDGTPGGKGPVGVSNFSSSGGSIANLGATAIAAKSSAAVAATALGGLADGLTLGLGRFNSNTLNFAAVIRALKGDGNTNVLSTPSLVTMDNQEAQIVVGQEVPFITGQYSATGTASTVGNPFQTINRKNVGITLKVKPQINEGDTVKLEIEQSVDSLGAVAGAADLVTNTRSIKTTVLVDDGKVLVLGGLIKDDLVESEEKVPLLGDIPLLGVLFRYKSTKKIKTNLMVFMRPVILRGPDDGMRQTYSKYNFMRDQQVERNDNGVALMPGAQAPMLPEFKDLLTLPPPYVPAAPIEAAPAAPSAAPRMPSMLQD